MSAEQSRLEELLRRRIGADEELREARERFRAVADERPFGLSHIALRHPDFASLEQVLDGLEDRLGPELKSRTDVRIFRPGDSDEIQWKSIQAFIYTDVAVSGISLFGQVFELGAYGEW
jgi:hypothetical protein